MKLLLALTTLVLVCLMLEEKARQVAGEAKVAYGEAVDQAHDATQSLGRYVKRQPLAAMSIASGVGFALARLAR